ncbi:hypothetical protein E2C01_012745 [Portunus trituberculatus]|uniref:Uncharacterized protein n=1 Tax=Portunus trituberculatus TaxID=210409 RepID=A0A5B7DFG3_PORTR|nr:hypothetical protein [Portunus trituberculatus]
MSIPVVHGRVANVALVLVCGERCRARWRWGWLLCLRVDHYHREYPSRGVSPDGVRLPRDTCGRLPQPPPSLPEPPGPQPLPQKATLVYPVSTTLERNHVQRSPEPHGTGSTTRAHRQSRAKTLRCTTRLLRRSYGRVSGETFEKTSFFSQATLVGETKTFTSNNHGARRPTQHCLSASLCTNTSSRRWRGLAGQGHRLLASRAAAPGPSRSWHDES